MFVGKKNVLVKKQLFDKKKYILKIFFKKNQDSPRPRPTAQLSLYPFLPTSTTTYDDVVFYFDLPLLLSIHFSLYIYFYSDILDLGSYYCWRLCCRNDTCCNNFGLFSQKVRIYHNYENTSRRSSRSLPARIFIG